MESTEEDLIVGCKAGDRAAWEVLIRRHHRFVVQTAYKVTSDLDLSEDVAQEAWLVVLKKIGSFHGESSFTTWAYRVVVNVAIASLRKAREKAWNPELLERLDPSGSDECDVGRISDAVLVRDALARLPDEIRLPLVLRVVDQLTYREISELLGIALRTVYDRVERGTERLRRYLVDMWELEGRAKK